MQTIVIWFQLDADTAFARNEQRDRRKADDHFAVGYNVEAFKQIAAYMQHPEPTEDFVVVSGKHSFPGQVSGVLRKLSDIGILKMDSASRQMVRPGLVNLVPAQQPTPIVPGKPHKRNIVLR